MTRQPSTASVHCTSQPGLTRIGLSILVCLLLTVLFASPLPAVAQVSFAPAAAAAAVAPVVARTGAQHVDAVQAEMVADVARAVPGQSFRIGLRLKHDPHWHTYWRNPGDSGLPTRFEPGGPADASYGDIVWPAPKRLAIGDLANYGYEDEVLLTRQVTLPPTFGASTARFEVLAQWLVCKDVCIPGEAALALELQVGTHAEPAAAGVVRLFDESRKQAPESRASLPAGWWQNAAHAYLVLPAGMAASRAEFFPYFEGVVRPAAAQSLVVAGEPADPGQALRLATVPAPTGQAPEPAAKPAAESASVALPEPPFGLLMVDGKAIEVALQRLPDAPSTGRLIAVAEVVPAAPPATAGLLDRLFGSGPVAGSVAATSSAATARAAQAFPSTAVGAGSGTLTLAIIGALIGGLILNLMPCVFPVIGLKVLSFSQAAAGDARVARRHALTFSGGVVLSFLAMGIGLLALRSAGEAAGWGFQMQSPLFVGAMALLFVLISLNLFGVFETGVSLTRLGLTNGAAANRGLWNSFWTGVIAVLVATPCTAPFMGSAVGFTISSPPGQTLLVFTALGIGMAAPYLLLGSAPRLLKWLPRPGPWLLVFKQLLAFPMLATSAWLAWVLTLQAGAEGLLRLLMSAILVAFAAWIYGRLQSARISGASGRGLAGLAATTVAGVLTAWQLAQIGMLPAAAGSADVPGRSVATGAPASTDAGANRSATKPAVSPGWRPWSADRVSQALADGRPVFVDFTAAWCISCQANKKLVLEREVTRAAFAAKQVELLRADWTSRDPAITAELARFRRNGVPLYLVYTSAGRPPLMLPELLTVDVVLAALAASRWASEGTR